MSTSTGISVGGLVSGLDTNSIIDQLSALEQQKVVAVTKKQTQSQLRLSALGTLQSKLSTLASKARELYKLDNFSLFKSTSSDDKTATITGTGEGLQGTVGVNVRQLASSWKVASKAMADSVTATGGAGTLTLSRSAAAIKTDPTKTTVDITIDANDSLKDIASKINAASGAGMTATIVNFGTGDTRLMLNGVDQGSEGFAITESSGGTVLSTLGLKSSSSRQTSDFGLRLASGGPAQSTSTLGSLYTGIGANNVADTDTIKLSYSVGGAASTDVTANAATISGGRTTKLNEVTAAELGSWMNTTFGGSGAGFSTALNSSGELVVTNSLGTAVDFDLAMGTGSVGTLQLGGSSTRTAWANELQVGQNAFYTMNGLSMSSETNTDTTTLNGATINLFKVSEDTTSDVQLGLTRDGDGIQKKVQEFLDAFNDAIKYIDDKTKTTVDSSKDANGQSTNKVTRGELATDSSVRTIKTQLRTMLTSEVTELVGKTAYTSLASVGITTDKDSGGLKIDSEKFQAALTSDFDGIRRLFSNSGWTDNGSATVGGWTDNTKAGTYVLTPSTDVIDGSPGNRIGDILFSQTGDSKGLGVTAPTSIAGNVTATFSRGVAGQLSQYISQLTAFDGSYKSNKDSVQRQIDDFGKQADSVQARVDAYRKTLSAQFSAMENAMLRIKNQSSAFLAQLG
ncbi:MAG TPA: flagellar filament capping protein FliD [Fibrobacteria bacterium]|nr:flagellar filament capping protein FliD [Fibrobacteria bacterium]